MTNHRGPPINLGGPYLVASPLPESHAQRPHGEPPSDFAEPKPKRQRPDGNETKVYGTTARSAVHFAGSPPMVDASGSHVSRTVKEPNLSTSIQPCLFPIRPSADLKGRNRQQNSILAIERAAMRHTVQTRAYVVEPPASAPRYQRSGGNIPDQSKKALGLFSDTEPADFFPWTGRHQEDVLNELTTRNGSYDKLSALQNESLSARTLVFSSAKNKSSLHILSSLLASALYQRQMHGNITIASTFKPPPRVTLTDTKKEGWLRDLANPAIPLRRLSRTIPHGIRGKFLLDHCLSKDIPTSRAVWLVKCVGANEIRAFKRKGTGGVFTIGGENKWIKDWTTNVEHFLEAIIDNCGNEHWTAQINYGLRLVSHIYAEHLLDHEQYSRWLIRHLSISDLDGLPFWLLMLNIYKRDLLSYRQHGVHLVEALLTQLNRAQEPANRVAYGGILQELVKECRGLMNSSPECFLLPQCWKFYQNIIQEFVVRKDPFLESKFNDLTIRNEKIEDRTVIPNAKPRLSPEKCIVVAMDSLARTPDYPKIAGACLRATTSHEELVKTCLQWAISTYRVGQFRVYAAARLLRIWNAHSVDLQRPLFNFLTNMRDIPNIDQIDFYRLYAELVSSKHLSVGRYLQWLMARGALHKSQGNGPDDICEARLLQEVPLHGLPTHILNLRHSLLSSLDISIEDEKSTIIRIQIQIAEQLPSLFSTNGKAEEKQVGDNQILLLSRTQKSELAWWIRKSLGTHRREEKGQKQKSSQESTLRVHKQDYLIILRIFEDLQEYCVFVDILQTLAKTTRDGALLAAITDTINYHFDTFNALGATNDLFYNLFSQRKLLPSQEGSEPAFTLALIDLASRLPITGPQLNRLRKEVSSMDPRQSAAAPSPISDNMVEAVHSDNPTFFEEMEQILTNGTSMDQPTLTRCFGTVTAHLEKSWDEAVAFPCRYPELLARLRAFDPKNFDNLVIPWLDTLVSQIGRPSLSVILIPMICHKVCTLDTIMARATKLAQNEAPGRGASISLEVLEMLSSIQGRHVPSIEYRSYRFHDQLQSMMQAHTESFIFLIYSCTLAAKTMKGPIQAQAEYTLRGDNVNPFVRMVVAQILIANKPVTQFDPTLQLALKVILSEEELVDWSTLGVRRTLSRLLDHASNFNGLLSLLGLQTVIESTLETAENVSEILADVLIRRLEQAAPTQVTLWSYLVSNLPADSALSIHERAEESILSRVGNGEDCLRTAGRSITDSLMDILAATSCNISGAAALSLIDQILEHFSKLLGSLLLSPHEKNSKFEPDKLAVIEVLLRLLTIHRATILDPKFPQPTLSRICLSLAFLHINLATSSDRYLVNHVFDVLAILSDSLLQDTRLYCIQTLSASQGQRYPRMNFVFGDLNALLGGEWLQLVSKSTHAPDTTIAQPYSPRRWEMVQDATPVVTENDTSLSLTLFGARRSVL